LKKRNKVKSQLNVGEFGEVETKTYLYDDKEMIPRFYHSLLEKYDIVQMIERFEVVQNRHSLLFEAHYYRNRENRRGGLRFLPTRYYGKSEYSNYHWHFCIEFDYGNPKEEFYKIEMHTTTGSGILIQHIDAHTYALLMVEFFESCSPHCQYDFNNIIEIFQNSKCEELKQYGEYFGKEYARYKKSIEEYYEMEEVKSRSLTHKKRKGRF